MLRKLLLFMLLILPIVSATSPIGFYYNETTHDTHIWNNGSVKQDYYYSGECNAQISNLPNEIWEKVTLGLTYGEDEEDLIDNYVELHQGGCNRIELTDNLTYVNITVWKQVTYLGKKGILAKNSYIELNDDFMKETFYFKSFDNINVDVWFILKRSEIDISNNEKDDYAKVRKLDNTYEFLNLTYASQNNLTIIRNQNEIGKGITLLDYETDEYIFFYLDTEADYKFIYNNENIFVGTKAGTFTIGQAKTLETYWVDADACVCFFDIGAPQTADITMYYLQDELNVLVGTSSEVGLGMVYGGGAGNGYCNNDVMYWEDDTPPLAFWGIIPQTDTDLDCNGAKCSATGSETIVNRTIDWEGIGSYQLRGHWLCASRTNWHEYTDFPFDVHVNCYGKLTEFLYFIGYDCEADLSEVMGL